MHFTMAMGSIMYLHLSTVSELPQEGWVMFASHSSMKGPARRDITAAGLEKLTKGQLGQRQSYVHPSDKCKYVL